MKIPAISRQLISSLLGVALISCSTTPHVTAGTEDIDSAHSVLLIQELSDGRVIHTWLWSQNFDISQYLSHARGSVPQIVLVSRRPRDCDEENRECINKCLDRPLPRGFGHITKEGRKKGGKAAYCRDQCWQAFNDCVELENLKPQEFTATDDAIEWLKRNRKAVLVGSVVIIAGVAFVVLSAGAGLLILAPAILLTAPAAEVPTFAVGGSP
jgi:hypothetical protein